MGRKKLSVDDSRAAFSFPKVRRRDRVQIGPMSIPQVINGLDSDVPVPEPGPRRGNDLRLTALSNAIEHAAHLLPAQGPITVFIHHNTLHAFEDVEFTEAVEKGGQIFGCNPYLSEERYREELGRGRIRFADLEAVLRDDLGSRADESIAGLVTRIQLRQAMLQYPVRFGPTDELLWFMAETDALRHLRCDASAAVRNRLVAETRHWVLRDLRGSNERKRRDDAAAGRGRGDAAIDLRDLFERISDESLELWNEELWESLTLQALWRICQNGVASAIEPIPPPEPPIRHRDLLLQVTRADSDFLVHDVLIRFCGAFLDQGLAARQLPLRNEGFYRAFCTLYRLPGGPPDRWLRGLPAELARLEDNQIGPLRSIEESLDLLGVPEDEWKQYLSETLLALRGWCGITRFLEQRPDRAVLAVPNGSLIELLAIRLVLDRLALANLSRDLPGFTGPLQELRQELKRRLIPPKSIGAEKRAFVLFQLSQVLGWTPRELCRLGVADWSQLAVELAEFSSVKRRRVFHLAYEHRFYTQVLDAVSIHAARDSEEPQAPSFQALFCIDEREESIRRHIEEIAPDAVTYSIAGFYFVDMYYRGADDAHYVPLCPVVMRPKHWVTEKVVESQEEDRAWRARARRAVGVLSRQFHLGSRSFAGGAVLSGTLGVLASIPLVARTFFPRVTAEIRKKFGRYVEAPPLTRLWIERSDTSPGPDDGHTGFTLSEMVDVGERVLRDTGLTSGFSRLVLTFGHGSSSINNPHESAYNCGACGGARGGPNGRAIAQILNNPYVREGLQSRGLEIPVDTVFVGAMHNTSSETFTYYDVDRVPKCHRAELGRVRELIEKAGDRNAYERCRRFFSAPLSLSYDAARQHVEGRAEDLAQVRTECGHATNALCIVGRRKRTRGLFLDRRAFLNSYDPTQDDAEGRILERILHAAVPVCAGINLEYYFSYVDNVGYGSGTKLPHNVAALIGVMDGAASDLRTGLPWQMVEIHEPVRILFIVETNPKTLLNVLERNPGLNRLVKNGWLPLATLDPDSPAIKVYRHGAFHDYQPQSTTLPQAASSVDWYRGWRDHLEFAEIGV